MSGIFLYTGRKGGEAELCHALLGNIGGLLHVQLHGIRQTANQTSVTDNVNSIFT